MNSVYDHVSINLQKTGVIVKIRGFLNSFELKLTLHRFRTTHDLNSPPKNKACVYMNKRKQVKEGL